ncbi:unnamed protein product [Ectocarpus fasciculatus]
MLISKKPELIYYDIQINNFQSTGTTSEPMRFSEMRNNPIIKNASDYMLSIVRFQLDTYSLPTFIADIEPAPNTDPNKMIETITLEYTDGDVTVGPLNLTWVPTNAHLEIPGSPQPLQETNTEYYYGNSFRHYSDIINTTLESLTTDLKTSVGAALDDLIAPKMIWNDDKQTSEIIGQQEFFDWNNNSNVVNIYFNRPLYGKLSSLPAIKNYNGTDGKIYKIYMKNDYNTKIISLDADGTGAQDFIKVSQEYSTISNWSPISSLVFTTSTLPIYASQLSEPLVYSNGNAISTKIPQNFAQVISDMATNDLCYKPNIIYSPSGEYRFIDMFGTSDITNIDVNVYWKDVKGNLNPFYLQSGASGSIKILFKLKK